MRRIVTDLLAGNRDHAREFESRFDDVQDGQQPEAVTVCCSDSRVLQDEMWGNDEPGHLFTCSNIGNRVHQQTDEGPVVSGDVLFPLLETETEVAVVVGHTGCGAVTATYHALRGDQLGSPPGIDHCLDLLRADLEPALELLPDSVSGAAAVNRLVEYNVDRQVGGLCASEDVPGGVTVVGAVYDFQDVYDGDRGEVHVVNVDGEHSVEALQAAHPEIAGRVDRLWEY